MVPIYVTQEDINNSDINSISKCIMATALKRHYNAYMVDVGFASASIYDRNFKRIKSLVLCDDAASLVESFDNRGTISPCLVHIKEVEL